MWYKEILKTISLVYLKDINRPFNGSLAIIVINLRPKALRHYLSVTLPCFISLYLYLLIHTKGSMIGKL